MNGAQDSFRSSQEQQAQVLSKQQPSERYASQYAYQCNRATQCRGAKFLCTMLLAFLTLHALCWISFFGHLHLALNSSSSLASTNHLLTAFALSDLLLVLLVSWWQRRTLKRAAHLTGLGRLLACLRSSSDQSTARRRARFYRQQQAGGAQNNLKVSPSNHSLFIVSQANQQQQGYGQVYGPAYAQHLYQTLGQPQHIYDSAGALNQQTPEQQQRQVMQLMQQRQVQQHNFTLSLLQQRRLQQQQQQQMMHHCPADQLRQPMTLKPAALLELDGLAKQQYLCDPQASNNESGEADGPLVALGSTGSSSSSQSSNNNNSNGSNQLNTTTCYPASSLSSRLQTTFGPSTTNKSSLSSQHQRLPTEPQLFSQQEHAQLQSSAESPINCISQQQANFPQRHATRCLASESDANHHQYYSIGHRPAMVNTAANYTDALKAAMQHQNELASAQQIRRAKRHQPMIDRDLQGNIYDVANYALQ